MPDVFIPVNSTPSETPEKPEQNISSSLPISIKNIMSGHKNPVYGFTAYKELPAGITFDTEEQDEVILLFLRMHFITNIPWIAASILLIAAPFLIGYVATLSQSPFAFIPPTFILIVRLFYYLIIAGYIFVNFVTWYFNVSLITNKRVLDVDFEDLIYKNISGTKLSQVQDVSLTQVGVIRILFDYGDVLIQTAAAVDNFELKSIPKPERVVQIVEALLGKELQTNVI